MQQFKAKNIVDLYKQVSNQLVNYPEQIRSPRGQEVREIIGANICIENPLECFWNTDCESRPYPIKYLKDELKAYLSCKNDLETFGKISKFWNKLSDDNETINSSYGEIVYDKKLLNKEYDSNEQYFDSFQQISQLWDEITFTQFEWVINSFKTDKETRQAIMFVASPYYQYKGNKDFICTLNYHFIINQDNELEMIVNRRSQDVHFGAAYDICWESVLQNIVLYEVQETYPEVTLGKYYLNCNSLHLYSRNFDTYKNMINDDTMKVQTLPPIEDNYFMNDHIAKSLTDDNYTYAGSDEFLIWLINT